MILTVTGETITEQIFLQRERDLTFLKNRQWVQTKRKCFHGTRYNSCISCAALDRRRRYPSVSLSDFLDPCKRAST